MKIQDKITYSIALTLFIVIFITSITLTQLFVINERNNKLLEIAGQNQNMINYIKNSYGDNITGDDFRKSLRDNDYFKNIEDIFGARIIIADPDNNILTNPSDIEEEKLEAILNSGNQIYNFFTFSRFFSLSSRMNMGRMMYEVIGNKKYFISVQDFEIGNSTYSSVFIKEQIINTVPPLRYMLNLLIIFLIAGLISIVAGIILSKNISGPILQLNKSVSRISDGDYSENIRIKSLDEIGILARNINHMKNKIQKSHQSLKEFTYILSHEIKNMLTSINGYAVGITEGVYSTEEEVAEALNIIKNKTKDLENITESLLMLSRIENKIIEISKEKIDIINIVDELVRFYEKELADNKLTILKSYNLSDNFILLSDKYLIQTVISNLINNAIKYSSPKSDISINISTDPEYLVFSVSNKGHGISDDEKNRIFNVFYRSKKFDFKNIKGFGLGLAISKKISAILDGELDFNTNDGLNTFIFKIPVN